MQLHAASNDTNVQLQGCAAWTSGGGGGGGGGVLYLVSSHPRAPWLHYHNGDGCWTMYQSFNRAKPETKSVQNITDLSRGPVDTNY